VSRGFFGITTNSKESNGLDTGAADFAAISDSANIANVADTAIGAADFQPFGRAAQQLARNTSKLLRRSSAAGTSLGRTRSMGLLDALGGSTLSRQPA